MIIILVLSMLFAPMLAAIIHVFNAEKEPQERLDITIKWMPRCIALSLFGFLGLMCFSLGGLNIYISAIISSLLAYLSIALIKPLFLRLRPELPTSLLSNEELYIPDSWLKNY